MVNYGVVLLIFLAIIITIGIVIVLIWVAVESSKPPSSQSLTSLSCPETVNIDALIQIPAVGADCITSSGTGDFFYIGKLGTGTYDYVVAPFVRQPFNVCIGFCTGYTGGICSGPNYNGQSAQANFNNCMKQLQCNLPLAARGQTLYYAFSPTCNTCSNCPQLS